MGEFHCSSEFNHCLRRSSGDKKGAEFSPCVLFVRDVHAEATEDELRAAFEPVPVLAVCMRVWSLYLTSECSRTVQHGKVVATSFARDRGGGRKGTALVQLDSEVCSSEGWPCGAVAHCAWSCLQEAAETALAATPGAMVHGQAIAVTRSKFPIRRKPARASGYVHSSPCASPHL